MLLQPRVRHIDQVSALRSIGVTGPQTSIVDLYLSLSSKASARERRLFSDQHLDASESLTRIVE